MFVQVIQGPGSDVEAVRATAGRWLRELEPGAAGWLGCTYGVTDDGTLMPRPAGGVKADPCLYQDPLGGEGA